MKSFKASELFRKTYFQIKVNKSGSVIISDLGESRGNRSSWGSFFCMLFPYFVYIAHFTKFTRGRSFLMKKNQKRKKVFGKKEKKRKWKNRPQAQSPRLNSPFPNARSEKRKIPAQNDRAAANPMQNPSTYSWKLFWICKHFRRRIRSADWNNSLLVDSTWGDPWF